jgi:hypothetical protein
LPIAQKPAAFSERSSEAWTTLHALVRTPSYSLCRVAAFQ